VPALNSEWSLIISELRLQGRLAILPIIRLTSRGFTMRTTPFFCGKDCGGNACPLLATVEDGRVTRVVNNPAGGRYIKGCTRGFSLPLEQNAPDRILTPLIRTGPRGSGKFREATWEEALRLTADRLSEIRARHGPSIVMRRASAGVTGALHGTPALLARFMNLFGGSTVLTGNYSYGAAQFILPYVLGDEWKVSGFDSANMQHAEMIILWGANVLETRQGPEVPQHLIEAKKRGAQIVSIEPRRSATVAHAATWWISCRPGTDAALMLAVLHVLLTEELADRPFIQSHSTGFDQLERYVLGGDDAWARSPAWAERICGVSAQEIVRFARAYAAARPALLFPGYSIQRVFAGEEPYRLAVALQVATGNFGRRGGSTGSINAMLPAPRIRRLPVPDIEPQPSVPVVRWPDAILEGRAGGYPSDIRALYNLGSNFLNQGSDIRKNMAAFERLDFAVTHEVFLTPTARHCDVIFPTATAFEKEDVGIPWTGNWLLYKPQVVPPAGQARNDYDVLRDLADRLGFGPDFSEGRSAEEWVQDFIDQSEIADAAEFRRTGIYMASDQERVGLAEFTADPDRYPLSTPSGRIEISSEKYARETGFPAIPTWQAAPDSERYPLQLITPKSPHRTHSQGSNIPELRERDPHALSMHPVDAALREVFDGDLVVLSSAQGRMRVQVRLSGDLMPGVVSLPEGIWVDLDAEGVDIGGAANTLTSTVGTAPGLACIMHAVPVQVTGSNLRSSDPSRRGSAPSD
jgi:anaerobic dimethyl sulfoxide reductase subunit A